MGMMYHRHKTKKNKGVGVKPTPISESVAKNPVEPVEEVKKADEGFAYTKTEISRSTTERLKEIGTEIGIEDADNKTGGELKKLIIEKLGL